MRDMDTRPNQRFMHLYELGLTLQDTGKRQPTRQTLIRRGKRFAEANGLRIFTVGADHYVSSAELDRLHHGQAA